MIENQEFTYIGKSTKVIGTLTFGGPTHLQGYIEGQITVLNDALLVLEIGSETHGKLVCSDLDIYGKFQGEIQSSGRVTIYPTAVFEGKIISRSIEILPGAVVNMNGHTENL